MHQRKIVLTFLLSGVMVSVPAVVPAAGADRMNSDTKASRYSDRDMTRSTKNEKETLEQSLKTGQDKSFYRKQIEAAGFRVTAINYDQPDYLEYEIVKGNNSYEVQIDFDKQTQKATEVDVAYNAWQADATERALGQKDGKSAFPSATTQNPERFSDRRRMKTAEADTDQIEKTLKQGQDKQFYRQQLEKMGYKITAVNYDQPDYVEWEIVKGNNSYEVQLDFDKGTSKATSVDVATNVWRADATKKALQQARGTTSGNGTMSQRRGPSGDSGSGNMSSPAGRSGGSDSAPSSAERSGNTGSSGAAGGNSR